MGSEDFKKGVCFSYDFDLAERDPRLEGGVSLSQTSAKTAMLSTSAPAPSETSSRPRPAGHNATQVSPFSMSITGQSKNHEDMP